jgi:hypothetical protein
MQPSQPTTMGQPPVKASRERPESVRPTPGTGQTAAPQPVPSGNTGSGRPPGQVRVEPGVERSGRRSPIPAPVPVAPPQGQGVSPSAPAPLRNVPSVPAPAPKVAEPAVAKPSATPVPAQPVQAPRRQTPQPQTPPESSVAAPPPATQQSPAVTLPEGGAQPPAGAADQSPKGRQGQPPALGGERGKEQGR